MSDTCAWAEPEQDYPPVTVYGQPNCLPCKRVLSKLDGAEIDYEYVDVTENDDARTYVTGVLKATSVPVIVTDTHDPIIGYQPDKLRELIDYLTTDEEEE